MGIHSGTVFNYHQTRRQTTNYLSDLELLQYDMMYGERYIYGGKDNAPTVDGTFQMGILDVTLTGVEVDPNGKFILYGENMTANSKVYVNGEKKGTTFVNDTRIELTKAKLKEGDTVVVSQVGSSSRRFRSSVEYRYNMGQLVLAENYVEPVENDEPGSLEGVPNTEATEGTESTENVTP